MNITMDDIRQYLFALAIFLPSLSVHEFAHAWAAYKFGDMTAKNLGRLTLNPVAHISPLGTILMPILIGFGWAKPVPVDFSILNKKQVFLVGAAGPLSNILTALVFTVLFHILPIHKMPLVGTFIYFVILYNFILAIFNLIPIPPLDGSRMVYAWLKSQYAINIYNEISKFGLIILLVIMWKWGFGRIIDPVLNALFSLLRLPLH
jgi:Zn-dependent protease